jgi:calcium-dependent protein kinase
MFADEHRRPDQIKIIDFGLATKYLSAEYKNMTEKVGTIYTIAPQVLQGVYTSKCDLVRTMRYSYIYLSL